MEPTITLLGPENPAELGMMNRAVPLVAAMLVFSGLLAGCSTPEQSATSQAMSSTASTPATTPPPTGSTTTIAGPPELELYGGINSPTAPWHAVAVESPEVWVSGVTSSGATLSVDAVGDDAVFAETTTADSSYFTVRAVLAPGWNSVTVTATLNGASRSAAFEARYEPEADVEFGFLEKVSDSGLVVDYAQWLTGEEAAQAAYEDGWIDSVEEGVPNDYYIRNVNPRLRTHPLAEDVAIWLMTAAEGPVGSVRVDMSDWLALFNDGVPWDPEVQPSYGPPDYGYMGASTVFAPYWLVLLNGEVIAIEQQYIP